MDEYLFNLRFTTKQLERLSKKAEKDQAKEQAKVKKAIQQKNIEAGRIYAENAIRKKNESLNYLRLAARVDAVSSRVQSAMAMKTVVKDMEKVSKGLDKAMKSMDIEQVSKIMEKFETQFEDLDVRTNVMEGTISDATALSTPTDQVEALIKQVADESGLEITDQLEDLQAPGTSIHSRTETVAASSKTDDLDRRLAALRQ